MLGDVPSLYHPPRTTDRWRMFNMVAQSEIFYSTSQDILVRKSADCQTYCYVQPDRFLYGQIFIHCNFLKNFYFLDLRHRKLHCLVSQGFVVLKSRRNESVDASGAWIDFFQLGLKGHIPSSGKSFPLSDNEEFL